MRPPGNAAGRPRHQREAAPTSKCISRHQATDTGQVTSGRFSSRGALPLVRPCAQYGPMPGKVTTVVVVDHGTVCRHHHVHLVRSPHSGSVIRRPQCGAGRYVIALAAEVGAAA